MRRNANPNIRLAVSVLAGTAFSCGCVTSKSTTQTVRSSGYSATAAPNAVLEPSTHAVVQEASLVSFDRDDPGSGLGDAPPIYHSDGDLDPDVVFSISPKPQDDSGSVDSGVLDLQADYSQQTPTQATHLVTIDQAIRDALGQNGSIRAAEAAVRSAQGQCVQSGLHPNPSLQYNGDEMGNEGYGGLHTIAIGRTHVTANKLQRQRQVASAAVSAAMADLEVARQRVATDVRSAFVEALVAQQRLTLVEQLREVARRNLRSVEVMVKAEESSRIALLQSQTEFAESELILDNAHVALDVARNRLAAVVGSANAYTSSEFVGDLAEMTGDIDFAQIHDQLISSSPEIAKRVAQLDRARRKLSLAFAGATPNFTSQVGVGYDTATEDTFASVQVNLPLTLHNRNQGNIRTAHAEITRADALLQRTEQKITRDLAIAQGEFDTARQRVRQIETEIIPRAQETLALSRQAFEAGEASYLQLLTIQRSLFQSKLRHLEATAQAAAAATRINGFLLSGSLD